MKKLFLSAALVAGSLTIASAQVNNQDNVTESTHVEESMSIERLSNRSSEDMTGRRVIMMEDLPESVQAAFTANKDFKEWKVQDIMEVEATSTEPIQYEMVLIGEDIQDEIEDANEDAQKTTEELTEDGAEFTQKMVSIRVPAVVLRYDAEGNLISTVEREPESEDTDSGIYRDDQ